MARKGLKGLRSRLFPGTANGFQGTTQHLESPGLAVVKTSRSSQGRNAGRARPGKALCLLTREGSRCRLFPVIQNQPVVKSAVTSPATRETRVRFPPGPTPEGL